MASFQNVCCKCKDQVTALGDFQYKAARQNCSYCHSQIHETCKQKECLTKQDNKKNTEIKDKLEINTSKFDKKADQLQIYLNNIKKTKRCNTPIRTTTSFI